MPVPGTGTFRVYPYTLQSVVGNGFSFDTTLGQQPANTAAAVAFLKDGGNQNVPGSLAGLPFVSPTPSVFAGIPSTGQYSLNMTPDTARIIFNPGASQQIVDILSAEFPTGFLATKLKVRMIAVATGLTSPPYAADCDDGFTNLKFLFAGAAFKTFTSPFYGTVGVPYISAEIISGDNDITPALTYWTAGQTFQNFGFEGNFAESPCGGPAGYSSSYLLITRFELNGEYIAWSDFSSISVSPTTYNVGNEVTISGPVGEITEVFVQGTVNGETVRVSCPIVSRTSTSIIVRIPIYHPSLSLIVSVVSTEFSGEVTLATLTPIETTGYGAYKLSESKRIDTYYDRTDPSNIVTTDLAIPTPFLRTGYF